MAFGLDTGPDNVVTIKVIGAVSYTHLRAHETRGNLVCRLLLEKIHISYVYPVLPYCD